ncbi:L-ribulose-5-phosphate 3-epimerase [Spiroplasma chinense]|uniref:L-ribulose-5-phosphate 3-epimerase n=1 Tax=Spiroplasma chinense TaxID=216932 RepID=A0A5B9Y5D2_9MOLU|nr:L-ribulose-5-phosphate 3-epimerase [Spiroplasma chinense]QEH62003.1 L-ribulose-5-phosphate 3-epimerase [Spiroplasma chinense]
MLNLKNNFLGVYEKALPKVSWPEKIKVASELGFDFIELSIDESDERLERLNWSDKQVEEILLECKQNNIFIRSICFSGQRRYPMGSHDKEIRKTSMKLLEQCIILAHKLGIKIIQLAGYDVFYEEKDQTTKEYFLKNLNEAMKIANRYAINLSIEIMDDVFINSISKFLEIKKEVNYPWLSVYPDLGNLWAWNSDNSIEELEKGFNEVVALHIKDTLLVKEDFPGKFKNVEFGEGDVDFKMLLKYLNTKQYSGSFVIEAWYEDFPKTVSLLENAKKYVLNIFKETGWELC